MPGPLGGAGKFRRWNWRTQYVRRPKTCRVALNKLCTLGYFKNVLVLAIFGKFACGVVCI
nr:MAG TPA: hypothetical protein [Caudoviricetes sp.]